MYPVKTPTAAVSKPPYSSGGTPGYFTKGDAVAGIPATVPGQDFFNMTQEELLNVIRAAGLTPDAEDDTQLTLAISSMISESAVSVGAATTEAAGVVELATNEETSAGTDTERAVTPAGLKSVTDAIYTAMPEMGLRGRDYYGTPGTYTWTPPEGVTAVYIIGAGGGAGYGGKGGGAGNSCLFERYEVAGAVSITIGAGGTWNVRGGGATSFGALRTFLGGVRAAAQTGPMAPSRPLPVALAAGLEARVTPLAATAEAAWPALAADQSPQARTAAAVSLAHPAARRLLVEMAAPGSC